MWIIISSLKYCNAHKSLLHIYMSENEFNVLPYESPSRNIIGRTFYFFTSKFLHFYLIIIRQAINLIVSKFGIHYKYQELELFY